VSLLVGAVGFGAAAVAQASNATIKATLKSANPTVLKDQAKVLDGIATYDKNHSSSALIKALKRQVSDLNSIQAKISGETASAGKGTHGKAEIVKGLALISDSDKDLVKDLQTAHGKQIPKSKLNTAVVVDKKGNTELVDGAKLLG
jgi:hypothetical protein